MRVFLMTLKTLSMMALLPFLGVMIFGPDLFMVFFGSRWQMAGIFSSVMAPMFFFKFISSPLSYMYFIAGRQREDGASSPRFRNSAINAAASGRKGSSSGFNPQKMLM